MLDANGFGFRLRLMDIREPWRTPVHWIHDIAYENLRDIDLRTVLFCIRDMRYRPPKGGDTTFDSLFEWSATAVAKHFAIHNLLSLIGLQPKLWMASYRMVDNLPITCAMLNAAADRYDVWDVHVYVTCDFGHGERIVDFTYPMHMASQEFTVTTEWSIYEDCILPFALNDSRLINPDATGLLYTKMWRQQLNPGLGMKYNTDIHAHIVRNACRDDADECRRDYIHRHYLRLPIFWSGKSLRGHGLCRAGRFYDSIVSWLAAAPRRQ